MPAGAVTRCRGRRSPRVRGAMRPTGADRQSCEALSPAVRWRRRHRRRRAASPFSARISSTTAGLQRSGSRGRQGPLSPRSDRKPRALPGVAKAAVQLVPDAVRAAACVRGIHLEDPKPSSHTTIRGKRRSNSSPSQSRTRKRGNTRGSAFRRMVPGIVVTAVLNFSSRRISTVSGPKSALPPKG